MPTGPQWGRRRLLATPLALGATGLGVTGLGVTGLGVTGLGVTGAAGLPGRAFADPPPPSVPVASPAPVPPADAAAPPPPTLEDLVTLELAQDRGLRMHVSATIDGRGPFPFLVDTGADHSVLSRELAHALGLEAGPTVRVNGISGSALTPSARVRRLEVGGRRMDDVALAALPRDDLGAIGFIGLDCLADQRISIDFAARRLEVRRSRGFASDPDAIVVHGKARFGRLILIDSSVRRTPIFVILDSGAENSLGNPALRALLERRRRVAGVPDPIHPVELLGVTGQKSIGDADEMAELTLGGVSLKRVPVVYGDFDIFKLYRLADEPGLLLGMDVLRIFARIGIDFGRREVAFVMPERDGVSMRFGRL